MKIMFQRVEMPIWFWVSVLIWISGSILNWISDLPCGFNTLGLCDVEWHRPSNPLWTNDHYTHMSIFPKLLLQSHMRRMSLCAVAQGCLILSTKGWCGCRFSFQSSTIHTWFHLFNLLILAFNRHGIKTLLSQHPLLEKIGHQCCSIKIFLYWN